MNLPHANKWKLAWGNQVLDYSIPNFLEQFKHSPSRRGKSKQEEWLIRLKEYMKISLISAKIYFIIYKNEMQYSNYL